MASDRDDRAGLPYVRPVLIVHGDVATVTRSTLPSGGECDNITAPNCGSGNRKTA